MNIKEAALEYIDWGLSIIPIDPNSKKPLLSWSEYQERQPTEDEIEQWFKKWPQANIALVTGQVSGVAAIDLDNEQARNWAKENLPRPNAWQKTGKGWHLLYKANGTKIPNAVSIIEGVDIRGEGGYILIAPSKHPSGTQYQLHQQANWDELIDFPIEKLPEQNSQIEKPPVSLDPADPGERNDTLARIAGRYLAKGMEFSEVLAICKGWNSDLDNPLDNKELEQTVESIWKKDSSQQNQQSQQNHQSQNQSAVVSSSQQKSASSQQSQQHFPGNLAQEIRQYVKENQGFFTTADIDREFGLTTRADKNRRSRALSNMVRNLIIKKDARVAGKYHIIPNEFEFIDLDAVEESYFPIDLPLNLSNMVNIPPKSVIVLAGTSNAGKTAILLETIRKNMNQNYPIMYLMSEMGPSEYKQRVNKMLSDGEEKATWKDRVKAASLSTGFDGPILQQNQDGLTVIDFLEEKEGEYYKIASEIRAIYDALNEGVAVIALQKHSQAEVGRGGEGTTEKARLYMTLDKLAHQPRSTISALKIQKAKDYPDYNPNGLEQHLEIRAGKELQPITEWIYCNKKQRESYIAKYEHMIEQGMDAPAQGQQDVIYRFLLDDGSYGNLRRRDYEKWIQNYPNVDVKSKLADLAEWSQRKPMRKKDGGWFFQLSRILENEQSET